MLATVPAQSLVTIRPSGLMQLSSYRPDYTSLQTPSDFRPGSIVSSRPLDGPRYDSIGMVSGANYYQPMQGGGDYAGPRPGFRPGSQFAPDYNPPQWGRLPRMNPHRCLRMRDCLCCVFSSHWSNTYRLALELGFPRRVPLLLQLLLEAERQPPLLQLLC